MNDGPHPKHERGCNKGGGGMGDRNGSSSRRISPSSLMWVAQIPGLQGVRMVGLTMSVLAPSMKVNGVPPCCQGLPHKIGVATLCFCTCSS